VSARNKDLCAKVIVIPDDNNSSVLTKGKPQGSTRCNPTGGHVQPIITEGAELKWKKAQKKAKKKKISEVINNIIPRRSPCCTIGV